MRLLMGASASHISGIPQWASVDGYGYGSARRPDRVSSFCHADVAVELSPIKSLILTLGSSLTVYGARDYHPVLSTLWPHPEWTSKAGTFSLHASGYLRLSIGEVQRYRWLAVQLLACRRPVAQSPEGTYSGGLMDACFRQWSVELSADIYYKRPSGASEYDGTHYHASGCRLCQQRAYHDRRRTQLRCRIHGLENSRTSYRLCVVCVGRAQRRFPKSDVIG